MGKMLHTHGPECFPNAGEDREQLELYYTVGPITLEEYLAARTKINIRRNYDQAIPC